MAPTDFNTAAYRLMPCELVFLMLISVFKDIKSTNRRITLSRAFLLILESGNFRSLWFILPLAFASDGESDDSFYNSVSGKYQDFGGVYR